MICMTKTVISGEEVLRIPPLYKINNTTIEMNHCPMSCISNNSELSTNVSKLSKVKVLNPKYYNQIVKNDASMCK